MTEHHDCSCGVAAPTHDELTDHLLEVFALAGDTAPDGQQHAEAARDQRAAPRRCVCGYAATSLDDIDHHILAAYTPPDATAPDGTRHVPTPADRAQDGSAEGS
jgi:hypothetical protein